MDDWQSLYNRMSDAERQELMRELMNKKTKRDKLPGFLKTWPFVERRREVQRYHLVGDRRRSALDRFDLALGLELPDPAHTWRFHLVIAITSVLVISIASITAESMPQNLLLVPAWALYVLGLLSYRNYRLSTAS